jgi:hypothetical protein
MQKPKLRYFSHEITELQDSFKNEELSNEVKHIIEESLDNCLSRIREEDELNLVNDWEVYEDLAAVAATLEAQARILRKAVRAFKRPLKDITLLINAKELTTRTIARWRLSIGR